jgi:hypothetical protein
MNFPGKMAVLLGVQMNQLRDSEHPNQSMITASEHVAKLHSPWGSHPSEKISARTGEKIGSRSVQ